MSWEYVVVNGKRMKRGYTTGSCAAAAAKAATYMLFNDVTIDNIEIDTPKGIRLNLKINDVIREGNKVSCSVIKDGGDDPDVTDGAHVFATVQENQQGEILVTGGEGIGIVTKPGLKVEVGKPAINPVPMDMIQKEVYEVLPHGKGVNVVISIPGGEELAKKTLNAKLSIIGGLSILGTTGIVEPMSEEAFKDSLAVELKMAVANNPDFVVLAPGNQGFDIAAHQLHIPEDKIVKISNFVGFMLDKCKEYGVKKILIIGHIGKLIKVSAGIFNTHSHEADARFEIFAANAALAGADKAIIKRLQDSPTTDDMVDVLDVLNISGFYDGIAKKVSERCESRIGENIRVGTIIYGTKRGILGMDVAAKEILEGYV